MEEKVKSLDIYLEDKVEIKYGYDIFEKFYDSIQKFKYDKIFFVTEMGLYNIHGKYLFENLKNRNVKIELIKIDGNERNKTFKKLEELCEKLIQMRISKDSIIVSFGGGIVGNVTGLVAALIYRGIKYIEIPTTFMGQTDSSLSNKQAVNGKNGKNQLGTYYAPIFVWTDIKYITTENIRHIRAAIVEGIKNALIFDSQLLPYFEEAIIHKTEFSSEELYNIFEVIVNSKNKILKQDPTEKQYAVVLEYGHTFGHAIEFLTDGEIIHGEAVAMGMCIAAEISKLLGYLSDEEVKLHYKLLSNFIYRFEGNKLEQKISVEQIYIAIQNDNKRTLKGIKYVLLEKIGTCLIGDIDYQVSVDKSIVIKGMNIFFNKYDEINLKNTNK